MKARDVFAALFDRAAAPRNLVVLLAAAIAAFVSAVPASAAPATLTLNAPTHSIVTAHLSGKVEVPADGYETYWCLEYAEEGVENWSGFCYQGPVPPGETANPETDLSLKAETAYEVRLSALNPTEGVEEHTAVKTFTTDPAVAPTLTLGSAEDVSADGVHISGTIDPEGGNQDAVAGLLPISWELQVNKDGAGWNAIGSDTLSTAQPDGGGTPPAASDSPIIVEASSNSLVPNSHYEYRLVAHYAGLEKVTAADEFDTPAVKPTIDRDTLWEPTPASIILRSSLDPQNASVTDCHFEWGVGGSLDHSSPCEGGPTARLSGLTPGTEYSFRLVATNLAGTTEGDVRSFTTPTGSAPESCPNEAHRAEQHAEHLSRCRAWEMVSPLEKGHGDVTGDGLTTVASKDGDALVFTSRTPFGDTVGSGAAGQSQFIARRSDSGWMTHAITPTGSPEAAQTFFAATLLQIYSEDLRTGIVWAYDLPEASGDSPLRSNIYALDTATRGLQPITVSQLEQPTIQDFRGIRLWGVSANARHVAFITATRFLPEAAPGVNNAYQWDDGALSLAGILPDGKVPPGGSDLIPSNYRGAMSADGTRLVFTASSPSGPTQLFMRIDGDRTVWITQPEHEDEQQNGSSSSSVALQGVTPDGHSVFFTTEAGLLDADDNGATDLYRYTETVNPSTDENLTLISHAGDMSGGLVAGMSDDGQRVYYQTIENRLSVWDEGVTRLISREVEINGFGERFGVMEGEPGLGRATPDGRYFAFALDSNNTYDLLGNGTNGRRNMYMYSLDNDTLKCVSCLSVPPTSDVAIQPDVTAGSPQPVNVGFRPQFLTRDGEVFFSTGEALVSEDTNGLEDAYEYDPASGGVSLLSSGKGSYPTAFADASASGDDVFLLGRQRLASNDTDDLVDVYDARVGSTLSPPVPHIALPCQGDGCQPPPAAGPAVDDSDSAVGGPGNQRSRRHRAIHCKKNQRKIRRHGKVRCVKKKVQHQSGKRAADTNRRAAR